MPKTLDKFLRIWLYTGAHPNGNQRKPTMNTPDRTLILPRAYAAAVLRGDVTLADMTLTEATAIIGAATVLIIGVAMIMTGIADIATDTLSLLFGG
jgi:hypothetical protein